MFATSPKFPLLTNGTRKFCSGDWLGSVTNEEFSALASSFQTVMWFGSEVKWGKFYDFILCQMTSRKFGNIKSFGVRRLYAFMCEHRSARRLKVLPDAYKDGRERQTDREESIMQSRNFAISSSLLRPGVIILMASTLSKRNGPINAASVSRRHRHRSICGDFMARGASTAEEIRRPN
jgi:hypothetical protein